MHIKKVWIKNFRSLEDIAVDLESRVSVIVGPNAAGKTTIMEAIRMTKALLSPRTQQEANQILHALGVSSPHMPQRLRMEAIARDVGKAVVVGCMFELSQLEISELRAAIESIVTMMIQARNGASLTAPDTLIAFLASPQGQEMQAEARKVVEAALEKVSSLRRVTLELTWAPNSPPRSSADVIEAQFISYLERRLPPYKTSFTYFPADRALPFGEQPMQLGSPDASAQLESYNSQPQTKFFRLKNTIFTSALGATRGGDENSIEKEFERIFHGILKGRELDSYGINEVGQLNVQIRDTESGRVFDMDGMSSGEKGLILTFLLLARSVDNDGIVLLDEPELHLNPAVCKDLLSYLVNQYVKPKNLQVIICSHSPEILAGAFDSDECSVYHLISSTNLSKVRLRDEANLDETLRRLGATESENLLYRGIIFVEGPHDVAILDAGFGNLLRRYKLKSTQGRKEIEKAIRSLQQSEKESASNSLAFFIFDRDDAPTSLKSSNSVKILQWDRRCLENYFIDLDAIADVLMNPEIVREPLGSPGEVNSILRDMAFSQLPELAARHVYESYDFGGLGLRRDDLSGKSIEGMSRALFDRLMLVKAQLARIDEGGWVSNFENAVRMEQERLRAVWETTWMEDCDGKRLIDDLSRKVTFRSSVKQFKIRLIKEMAINQSASWKVIEAKLREMLSDGL